MADSTQSPGQRQKGELAILHDIAAALNGSVELHEALETVLQKAGQLLGLQTGWIWLLDPETAKPYLAAARKLPADLQARPELMEGGCRCLNRFGDAQPQAAANINVLTCSRLGQLPEGTDGFQFHASVPLISGESAGRADPSPGGDADDESGAKSGNKLGVLNLASRDWRALTDAELGLLRTISDMLSVAIERTRLFSRSTQLGAARERNRLAREIHDTLAQSLTGIVMQLETADALLDGAAATNGVARPVHRALELSRQTLEEARRSVRDLRAAPLEDRSLAEALDQLCCAHEVADMAAVDFAVVGAPRRLPTRLETGVFRICQEALNNIAAHARAEQVEVCLHFEAGRTTLEIRDDGVGFDPQGGPEGGFGLVGMNERARLMGGELAIETSWTDGTRVVVDIPTDGSSEIGSSRSPHERHH